MRVSHKLIGIGLVMGLVVGTFGAGFVLAQFLATKSATTTVTVAGVTLTLSSTNGTIDSNGNVTCPGVTVSQPDGYDPAGCQITIVSTSSAIDVKMSSSVAGGNEFGVTIHGGGTVFPLTTAPVTVATFASAPQTITPQLVWGSNAGGPPVDQNFYNTSFVITFAITAAST